MEWAEGLSAEQQQAAVEAEMQRMQGERLARLTIRPGQIDPALRHLHPEVFTIDSETPGTDLGSFDYR